jgi:DNA polymerase
MLAVMRATPLEDAMLEEIAAEVRVCQLCELARTRTHAVPGEGPERAPIMFIGEGPGLNEDQQGRPFVGAAGKFLSELLDHAGLKREDVFITNVVKCRPPGNRDPLPDEMAACGGYLQRQIDSIDPTVIVTLGRFSMSKWFPGERITRIHGQPKKVGARTIVPMFHPAAALHQGNLKPVIQEDFARLRSILDKAQADRLREAEPEVPKEAPPEQMSLF